jgi:hypothetical protein
MFALANSLLVNKLSSQSLYLRDPVWKCSDQRLSEPLVKPAQALKAIGVLDALNWICADVVLDADLRGYLGQTYNYGINRMPHYCA